MSQSSKVCPSFVACVVGLSMEQGEPFGRRPGVGKSCLCHRFTHPGFDDYVSSHESLYALHEFESRVINNDHFLYWGSPVVPFPSTDPAKEVNLRVHIVEHNVCYQDITCQPFTTITKPDKPEVYVKRITGPMESPGKISYQTRDDIAFPEHYNVKDYPTGITKVTRGFIVVVDASQKGDLFERQIVRAEKVLDYLTKHKRKNVIAATKRDIVVQSSLERVYELKKKYRTHVVEVSSEKNLNVKECFRVLAQKLFKGAIKNLFSQVQTFHEAAHLSLAQKGSAKRSFLTFLKKRIVDPDDRIDVIENNEEYKTCLYIVGKYDTDKLFAEHILDVFNEKVDLYAGVKENPDMRQEFLEEFVDRRSDLAVYCKDLRKWIDSLMANLPSVPDEEVVDSLTEIYDIPQPVGADSQADDSYQFFERKAAASPSQSRRTQDSGFPQDGASFNSCETEVPDSEGHDNDSYYSDSSGEEGPDYVNFDPSHPPTLLAQPNSQSNQPINKQPLVDPTSQQQQQQQQPTSVEQPLLLQREALPLPTEQSHTPLSRQMSIKNRALALGGLLGHSPIEPTKSAPPPPAPRPKPSRSAVSTSSAPDTPKPSRPAVPTSSAPDTPKPSRSAVSTSSAPDTPKPSRPAVPTPSAPDTPKPSRSAVSTSSAPDTPNTQRKTECEASQELSSIANRARQLQKVMSGEEASDNSDNGSQSKRTPPPPLPRNSSLPRKSSLAKMSSSDSDDSQSPCTTTSGGTRKPARVAPPPPQRKCSEVSSPTTRSRSDKELVTLIPAAKKRETQESRDTVSVPTKTTEEKQQIQLSPQKKKLDDIRKKIYIRRQIKGQESTDGNNTKIISTVDSFPAPPVTNPHPTVVSPSRKVAIDIYPTPDSSPTPESPPPLPPRLELQEKHSSSDESEPPALPPRTQEMFEDKDKPIPKQNKPVKAPRKDYINMFKKSKEPKESKTSNKKKKIKELTQVISPTRSKEAAQLVSPTHSKSMGLPNANAKFQPSEQVGRELPPEPVSNPSSRSQFLVMKNRPLPLEPFASAPDEQEAIDEDHDYELFDMNLQQSLLAKHVSGLAQSSPASNLKKSNTFNTSDMRRPPAAIPRPLVPNLPSGVWKDYIDSDGYVDTEPPPRAANSKTSTDTPVTSSMQSRCLPLTPFERQAKQLPSGKSSAPDYDYPELRSFFMPNKGHRGHLHTPPRMSPQGITSLPRRKKQSTDVGHRATYDDEYIPMQAHASYDDDSYINSETIDQIRGRLLDNSSPEKPSMGGVDANGRRYSMDDLSVYMNLPMPEPTMSLTPRGPPVPDPTMSLPPRGPPVPDPLHSITKQKQPPPVHVKPNRPRASTTMGGDVVEPLRIQPSKLSTELHTRLAPRLSSPPHATVPATSQSFDQGGLFEHDNDQEYVNVDPSASLPPSFSFQHSSPAVPVRVESQRVKRERLNTPVIGLPPRNIKRENQ